jgi:mono/diheme cytochrome c family protein
MEGPMANNAAAAVRGEVLARAHCGSCHALGLSGESSFSGAPAFREMRYDYNAISYDRRMGQLHRGGAGMPPPDVDLAGLADIGAYVRSLKQAGGH